MNKPKDIGTDMPKELLEDARRDKSKDHELMDAEFHIIAGKRYYENLNKIKSTIHGDGLTIGRKLSFLKKGLRHGKTKE